MSSSVREMPLVDTNLMVIPFSLRLMIPRSWVNQYSAVYGNRMVVPSTTVETSISMVAWIAVKVPAGTVTVSVPTILRVALNEIARSP